MQSSSSSSSSNISIYELYKDLKQRLDVLEDQVAKLRQTRAAGDDLGVEQPLADTLEVTREQMMTIKMYCANQTIGWKTALRRIMIVVFGNDVLSSSCTVGRRNSKHTALPNRKIDVIKGINVHICFMWYNVVYVGLMHEHFGSRFSGQMTNESMNVIISSCCCLARRGKKGEENNEDDYKDVEQRYIYAVYVLYI